MSVPKKLELTVKLNEFPANVKTIENGWKQFEVDTDGRKVTLTLKPEVFNKLEQAQKNYPQGVAKIVGQIGAKTDRGFVVQDCQVNIYSQSNYTPNTIKQSGSGVNPNLANNTFAAKHRLYTGENLNWLQVTLRVGKSIFPFLLPWLLFFSGYGFFITFLYRIGVPIAFLQENHGISKAILIFNVGLPLLLVFRTNTAHERFWEGRKLWGSLVNTIRNLTRGIWIIVREYSPQDRVEKEAILRLVVAFAFSMKLHLRGEPVNDELASLMTETQYFKLKYRDHPPLQIAFWIGDYLQQQHNRNCIDVYRLSDLQRLVDKLIDILGGCERILKTPLPLIYPLILRKLVLVYCLVVPFEIVKDWTWVTSTITTFVSLILLSVDQIASEIEEPFGHNLNDLPLDEICNTILQNTEDLIKLPPSSNNSYHL